MSAGARMPQAATAASGPPAAPAAPLLSARWYRFAAVRPSLAGQVRVQRIVYRGTPWWVLEHGDSLRSFRLNRAAHAFVGRFNGQRTLQSLWEMLLAEQADDVPTQDELLQLLVQLQAAGLVSLDRRITFAGVAEAVPDTAADTAADATPARRNSLLSMRIPLGRPEPLLDRLLPHLRWLFTPGFLLLWLLAVGWAALAAVLEASALAAHWQLWSGTPRMLALLWVAYPSVKALHELGHALVLRHLGLRVPEWGVTVMLFTPVPYVDASAAALLPSARQRALVGAAGIMVELLLAAAGLALALHVQPGLVRDLGLAVFFIGAVSTLLVNGNPLMRFDGYHVLADALQLPNLAPRSVRWWLDRMQARLLKAPPLQPLQPAAGEAPWLWLHAPLALAWRWSVSTALVLWAAQLSFVVALALGLLFGWMLAGRPLLALWRWLRSGALADAQRTGARLRLGLLGAALLAALAVPLPDATVVRGVVWLPDDAMVRAGADGFVEQVSVRDGQPVAAGTLLFTLASPTLATERQALAARIEALDVEYFEALATDTPRAVNLGHELDAARAELARADQRLSGLAVRAAVAGTVAIAHADDLPGRHVKQGTLLAHLLPQGTPALQVRAAIGQDDAARLAARPTDVSLRLADAPDAPAVPARWLHGSAAAVDRLPSAALAQRSGGPIATDPQDREALTPAAAVVLADLQALQATAPAGALRVGARAWVRFGHGHAPLAWQAAWRLQQLFLRHFDTTR